MSPNPTPPEQQQASTSKSEASDEDEAWTDQEVLTLCKALAVLIAGAVMPPLRSEAGRRAETWAKTHPKEARALLIKAWETLIE